MFDVLPVARLCGQKIVTDGHSQSESLPVPSKLFVAGLCLRMRQSQSLQSRAAEGSSSISDQEASLVWFGSQCVIIVY